MIIDNNFNALIMFYVHINGEENGLYRQKTRNGRRDGFYRDLSWIDDYVNEQI